MDADSKKELSLKNEHGTYPVWVSWLLEIFILLVFYFLYLQRSISLS